MNTSGRPLSPHLTIYRWPITMVLSIIHRITGVALSVGLVALVAWLVVIAYDFIPYDPVLAFMRSLSGRVVLFGFSFAFFFHLSNGIRHLIWDTGRLFEKRQVDTSAWIVLLASVSMTLFYWFVW
ncbi:MAG: succinate dehydrogenase, cytochrome b556 subunit [Pseudomonadota bacterium]|nr:succinate dehydrogenase, cytochrome b556 subunit [Pseudomonadota bacterium]